MRAAKNKRQLSEPMLSSNYSLQEEYELVDRRGPFDKGGTVISETASSASRETSVRSQMNYTNPKVQVPCHDGSSIYGPPSKHIFGGTSPPRGSFYIEPPIPVPKPAPTDIGVPISHLATTIKQVDMPNAQRLAASKPLDNMPNRRESRKFPPSSTESLGTQNNASDASIDAEWEFIQRSRVDILSLRSTVQQKRAVLRAKQYLKSEVEDRLFQRIRKQASAVYICSDDEEEQTLAQLMQDCQTAKDEYGPLEYECNQLEDSLSWKEFDLARREDSFYRRWRGPTAVKLTEPVFQVSSSQHSSVITSDVPDEHADFQEHPFVTDFLSKWGDLDLLQESLDDVEERKQFLEDRMDENGTIALYDLTDQLWLEGSQKIIDELSEKIKDTERDLKNLKQRCLEYGLVDEDGEPTEFPTKERGIFSDEKDVNPKGELSEYAKYPSLLPDPGRKQNQPSPHDRSLEPDAASDISTWRVNTWLLERLRTSALDVKLLANTYLAECGDIEDFWEGAVLDVWYNDATSNRAAIIRVYTSSMTTPASVHSPSENFTL